MKIFLLTIVLAFSVIACSKKETITKEEVMAALNRFDEGWRTKNASRVDSVLSPSYIYFTQSGGSFSRNNVVETAASDDYILESVSRQQFDIKIDGNTAVVNTVWRGQGAYFGKPFKDKQRCSVTLVKRNGEVKILSEHCTPMK